MNREQMVEQLVIFHLEQYQFLDREEREEHHEKVLRTGHRGYSDHTDSEIEVEWASGPGHNVPVDPPYVFSWRDYAIVKTHGGYRVNIMDTVFPTVERCIEVIESDIEHYEGQTGQKWHRTEETDLICVVHNCLYWQCACGAETGDIRLHGPVVKS